jgi:hypothetical protein
MRRAKHQLSNAKFCGCTANKLSSKITSDTGDGSSLQKSVSGKAHGVMLDSGPANQPAE